jgi:hypothetical protein
MPPWAFPECAVPFCGFPRLYNDGTQDQTVHGSILQLHRLFKESGTIIKRSQNTEKKVQNKVRILSKELWVLARMQQLPFLNILP